MVQCNCIGIYAVIQGRSYKYAKKWYKAITKDHEFDGYALPIVLIENRDDVKRFYEQMKFVKSLDRNFHFLGNCNQLSMLLYSRLAYLTKKKYTFDSSTASNALQYGVYYEPRHHHPLNFTKNEKTRVNFPIDGSAPCNCPVCEQHTIREMIGNPFLMMNHNVYIIKEFNKHANIFVHDDSQFNWFLKKIVSTNELYKPYSKELIKQGKDLFKSM